MGLPLMNMLGLSIKCKYHPHSMLPKIIPFALYTSPVSTGFAKQIMPILHILSYNGSLVT
jgi:hypothetical protein